MCVSRCVMQVIWNNGTKEELEEAVRSRLTQMLRSRAERLMRDVCPAGGRGLEGAGHSPSTQAVGPGPPQDPGGLRVLRGTERAAGGARLEGSVEVRTRLELVRRRGRGRGWGLGRVAVLST